MFGPGFCFLEQAPAFAYVWRIHLQIPEIVFVYIKKSFIFVSVTCELNKISEANVKPRMVSSDAAFEGDKDRKRSGKKLIFGKQLTKCISLVSLVAFYTQWRSYVEDPSTCDRSETIKLQ